MGHTPKMRGLLLVIHVSFFLYSGGRLCHMFF